MDGAETAGLVSVHSARCLDLAYGLCIITQCIYYLFYDFVPQAYPVRYFD